MSRFKLEGLDRLDARLKRIADKHLDASGVACAACAEHVKAVMVRQFLNGQVIGRDTNTLFSTWSVYSPLRSTGPTAVLHTPTVYARAQEYGYVGEVQVRSHQRRVPFKRKPGESTRKYKSRRTIFQESPEGAFSVTVAAHSRNMNLRPRRFLGGALDVARPDLPRIALAVWRREVGN